MRFGLNNPTVKKDFWNRYKVLEIMLLKRVSDEVQRLENATKKRIGKDICGIKLLISLNAVIHSQ